jgi:hypothetical protein
VILYSRRGRAVRRCPLAVAGCTEQRQQ